MADGFSVDTSELDRLVVDLGEAPKKAGRNVRKALEVNARHVRDDWRDRATGFAHSPAYPYSITYDLKSFQGFGATVIEAEIGPDKERAQGGLGNLLEFGSVNNGGMGLGLAALQANQADLEKGLAQALEDSL